MSAPAKRPRAPTPPPKRPPAAEPKPGAAERLGDALEAPGNLPVIDAAGDYAKFALDGIRGMRRVGNYAGEALRQVALIASGSVLVLVLMSFLAGATCGIEGSAIARGLGSGAIAPYFATFCTTREIVPFIFGFIVAAKIGGGIVAQLGSMRVNEEIDAMEVMGVPAITYLVSTRMLAAAIMLPFAYLISLGAAQGAAWLASYVRFGDVSQGTWESFFYTALDPIDIVYSLIKGMVLSAAVVITALYFGYRVRGGPVEVGVATAQSMAANLVLVTVLNMLLTFVFWGFNPNLPVA